MSDNLIIPARRVDQPRLAVVVHLQLDDAHLGGVDADKDGGAGGLLPLDVLDVDAELIPVALHHLVNLMNFIRSLAHFIFIGGKQAGRDG